MTVTLLRPVLRATTGTAAALLAAIALSACGGNTAPEAEGGADPAAEAPAEAEEAAATGETGVLQVKANGEDFVRQGFETKDGWQVTFDALYANLADVTAYQTDPPYEAEKGEAIAAPVQEVTVAEMTTVDLAEGDETAEPLLVAETEAPAGRYNALSWKLTNADDGPAAGAALMLVGQAVKDGETVDFVLKIDRELAFSCGDYVGDGRKGILEPGATADLEATFHFDHLFGDGEAPADDEINTGALGFDPLAALAENGSLETSLSELEGQLSPEDYATLEGILPSLGHVGEGHCHEMSNLEDAA